LRHTTSSFELSRIAQENNAVYSSIDPSDSSSSKLHAWRELVRLKEARTKAERENAQLERSKHRNGYSNTLPVRTSSRSSSRARGPVGEVGDDAWILPGLRPGSAGSRMRTASPGAGMNGSYRSQDGGKMRSHPRGRDVFGTPEVQEQVTVDDDAMVDEQNSPAGLLLPPPSRGSMMNDVDETPRRKRPGYFSAREEDLDPLEMDVEDFIMPARKKQKSSGISTSLHQGPKFAALWEPSRRENWPLGEVDEDANRVQEQSQRKEDEERERIKNNLMDLESPAFKLPPRTREEKDTASMDIEQSTPTKAPEKDDDGFKLQFSKTPAIPSKPAEKDTSGSTLQDPKPLLNPLKPIENGPASNAPQLTEQSTGPIAPPKPVEKSSETMFQSSQSIGFLFGSPKAETSTMPSTSEVPKPIASPSKIATTIEAIPSDKFPNAMEIPVVGVLKEPGVETGKVTETQLQSSVPVFPFNLAPSQGTLSGISQETSNVVADKSEATAGLKFGGSTSGFSGVGSPGFTFKLTSAPPAPPPNESMKVTSLFTAPVFEFGTSQQSEAPKPVDIVDTTKPAEIKANPAFGFDKTEPKQESAPVSVPSIDITESKKEPLVAPALSGPSGFGSFGSAFTKSEPEKSKELFGVPASENKLATDGALNGINPAQSLLHSASTFGTGVTSGYKFGRPTETLAPKKEATPPPIPASIISQEVDDSMDITDSPPASRSLPFTGLPSDVPSRLPVFPTSAPTSAPSNTVEPPKPTFQFGTTTDGQVNGTTDKPVVQTFKFGAPTEKNSGFSAPTFGASTNPPFGATTSSPSPAGFGGFGGAFTKKDETKESQKPAEKPFFAANTPTVPVFAAPAPSNPTESNPVFGGSTTAGFGNTAPTFGNTNAFPPATQSTTTLPPTITSPPTAPTFAPTFSAPASNAPQSFGSGSTFSFTSTAPINNPFTSNPAPAAATAATFQGANSTPVNNMFTSNSAPVATISATFQGANPASVNNPFTSNPTPAATTPATFQGANSAPVSPQNQQLTTFPGVQPQFGAAPQSTGSFGGTTIPSNAFQFSQTIPQSPIFTLGSSQMQRTSSDTGPNNASPGGRKIAQPRRRLNRRG
jgi:hypothetical protein